MGRGLSKMKKKKKMHCKLPVLLPKALIFIKDDLKFIGPNYSTNRPTRHFFQTEESIKKLPEQSEQSEPRDFWKPLIVSTFKEYKRQNRMIKNQ